MKPLLLFFLLFAFTGFGQYKCKKTSDASSSTETCYHKNGKKSTVTKWDKSKQRGTFKAYDHKGNEIASFELRHYGGHAGVQLEYYKNGQVKRIDFSEAPDGGIQHYNSTTTFNETGKQISFTEENYPEKPLVGSDGL